MLSNGDPIFSTFAGVLHLKIGGAAEAPEPSGP
jgi:hypothetical protein